MKVYITKYALSSGILLIDVDDRGDGVVKDKSNSLLFFHGEGNEWHRTFASAKPRAEEMRVAKIASLEKQLAKLRAMTFEEPK